MKNVKKIPEHGLAQFTNQSPQQGGFMECSTPGCNDHTVFVIDDETGNVVGFSIPLPDVTELDLLQMPEDEDGEMVEVKARIKAGTVEGFVCEHGHASVQWIDNETDEPVSVPLYEVAYQTAEIAEPLIEALMKALLAHVNKGEDGDGVDACCELCQRDDVRIGPDGICGDCLYGHEGADLL
jgi:hypothetical protein